MAAMSVLFVCTGNSCRSQMAEALARHLSQGRVQAASAGTAPAPIDPLTLEVLNETGVDTAALRSKGLEEFRPEEFDWVVTLCGEADAACPVVRGRRGRMRWPIPDPARVTGGEQDRRQAYRAARDRIRSMLELWLSMGFPATRPSRG